MKLVDKLVLGVALAIVIIKREVKKLAEFFRTGFGKSCKSYSLDD